MYYPLKGLSKPINELYIFTCTTDGSPEDVDQYKSLRDTVGSVHLIVYLFTFYERLAFDFNTEKIYVGNRFVKLFVSVFSQWQN